MQFILLTQAHMHYTCTYIVLDIAHHCYYSRAVLFLCVPATCGYLRTTPTWCISSIRYLQSIWCCPALALTTYMQEHQLAEKTWKFGNVEAGADPGRFVLLGQTPLCIATYLVLSLGSSVKYDFKEPLTFS